jgi:hypothetical protein
MPGVALEQPRCRVHQERKERAFGFGQIERAFQGTLSGNGVAERVPGDRLQQKSLNLQVSGYHRSRAVQDRRERGGRPVQVALGYPKCCGGGADLPTVAVWFAEFGEGLLGVFGLAEAH